VNPTVWVEHNWAEHNWVEHNDVKRRLANPTTQPSTAQTCIHPINFLRFVIVLLVAERPTAGARRDHLHQTICANYLRPDGARQGLAGICAERPAGLGIDI
jgi:hypothetical protein